MTEKELDQLRRELPGVVGAVYDALNLLLARETEQDRPRRSAMLGFAVVARDRCERWLRRAGLEIDPDEMPELGTADDAVKAVME